MKQKIKEALQQGHKNLGLSDEVFERVAASVETFITDEADIDKYVKSELVNSLLKFEQADADRKRAKREGEKKEPDNGNNPPEPKPEDDKVPAWAQLLLEQNKTLAEQNKSFAEKLNAFETAKTAELAVKQAQEKFGADEWVNGYPELRDSAWAQAMRIYDRTGKSMTAEELHTEAMEIFKPLAKAKGLDISKPFQSDGGAGGSETEKNEAFADEIRNALGMKKEG
jgi:hypothetical protein